NVGLTNGYAPSLGDSFSLVSYPSYSGSFASVSLPSGGLSWQTNIGATALTVVVTNRTFASGSTNFTWNAGIPSGDWQTPVNWIPVGVPGSVNTANITNGASVTVSAAISVGSLNLTSGAGGLGGTGSLKVLTNCNWTAGTSLSCPMTIASNVLVNL